MRAATEAAIFHASVPSGSVTRSSATSTGPLLVLIVPTTSRRGGRLSSRLPSGESESVSTSSQIVRSSTVFSCRAKSGPALARWFLGTRRRSKYSAALLQSPARLAARKPRIVLCGDVMLTSPGSSSSPGSVVGGAAVVVLVLVLGDVFCATAGV